MVSARSEEHSSLRRLLPVRSDSVALAFPLVSVAAYSVAFIATLPALLTAIYASADVALAPYLTQEWLHSPGGSVILMGHAPFYAGYWLLRFLHTFADYRESWELAPWVLSAVSILAVGMATSRAVGRAAGLLVSTTLICAGSLLLQLQFAWSVHGLAYVNIALLGAFTVWLTSDQPRAHPVRMWLAAFVLAALTAAGIATDKIVLLAGLAPFAITGIVTIWRADTCNTGRVARPILALVVGSLGGSLVIHALMQGDGMRATPYHVSLAAHSAVPGHLLLIAQSVFSLLNGDIGQPYATPTGALGYLCAAAVGYLLILAVREAGDPLRSFLSQIRSGREDRPKVALDARGAQATYWTVSAGLLVVAYLFTTVGIDIATRRYLVTVAYAVVILGVSRAATLSRLWRLPTTAAVAALILTGAIGLFQHSLRKAEPTAPTPAMAKVVTRLTDREHVTVVYTGYWDAYPLAWLSPSNADEIYPVLTCGSDLCAWTKLQGAGTGINTWYTPRRVARSLLVLDNDLDRADRLRSLPPRSLGSPAARYSLAGGRLHAYLYDYDIAARFGV